jgi:hypothetical protein
MLTISVFPCGNQKADVVKTFNQTTAMHPLTMPGKNPEEEPAEYSHRYC